jgi:thiol-disulfide isomerase/thioredoxin
LQYAEAGTPHVKPIIFCIVLFLAAVAAGAQQAPEYAKPDLSGTSQSLSSLRGRVVVLNFWATWCVPCAKEMPMLQEAQQKYGNRLAVVAVSVDGPERIEAVRKFVAAKKLTFPIWLDGKAEELEQFGLGESLPATAFINEKGEIEGRVIGQLKKKSLQQRLAWMLGDKKGNPPPPRENNLQVKEDEAPLPLR